MKQNNALSWSFLLMATCLFGIGLGLSLGYAIFRPKMAAPPADSPAPIQQASATEAAASPPVETAKPTSSPAQASVEPAAATPKPAETTVVPAAMPATATGEPGYWAARHLFIAVNGQWLADGTREMLKELRPGGVLLQDVNLGSRTQTFALVKEIKAAVGLGEGLGDLPLMAVQQEVGPYNLLGLENAPSAQTLGQNGDPELARKLGQEYGAACVGRGIAIAFAPVLDVFEPGAINPGFAVRSFGTEHTLVARIALAMADGLRQGGVLPVVKHFPGYGAATYGSDGLLVALNKDPAGLGKLLYPFDQAVRRGVPGMLVAHVAVPALDPENPRRPAALSPVLVTELLRVRWGYEGVIVADDVALNPMTRSIGAEHAAVQALAAGCDAVILLDPDPEHIRAVCTAIAAAVERGTLLKEKLQQSVARLTRWQEAIGNLNPIKSGPEVEHVAEAVPSPAAATPEPTPPTVSVSAPEPGPTQIPAAQAPAVELATEVPSAETIPQTTSVQAPAAEVPAPAADAPAPATEEKPVEKKGGPTSDEEKLSRIEYTVREGDLLSNIARDYGVTVEDLVRWNTLESAQVAPGSKLTMYLGDGTPLTMTAETAPAVEAVEAPPTPTEPVGFGGKAVHTVAEGETLTAIAEKFNVATSDIKLWNGIDTDTPAAGTVLTIFLGSEAASEEKPDAAPAPEQTKPQPEAAPVASTESPAAAAPMPEVETEPYTVLAGDTVSKISRTYKTTVEAILALNGLKDPNQIVVGQELKVPKAAP